MRGFGGMLSAATVGAVLIGSFAVGCGGREVTHATCSDDADCGAAERCERSRSPGASPQIRGKQCPYVPCMVTGDCDAGLVCGPTPSDSPDQRLCGMICVAPCTEGSCGPGRTCEDSGVCRIVPCDEPAGLACPEHWSCEPGSPDGAKQHTDPAGSAVVDPPEAYDLVLAGCVRKTCAEEDGYACADFYACDPSVARTPSGCVEVPCATSGHCSSDTFICTPTSSASRYAGNDVFGCVVRNCEEGADCSSLSTRPGAAYCEPSAPDAKPDGCALHSCAEGDYCSATEICAPGASNADAVGCAPSPGGAGGTGSATGGTGGTTAAAGGTTGGTSESGQDFGPGRCIPR